MDRRGAASRARGQEEGSSEQEAPADGFWAGFEQGRAAAVGKAPPPRLSRVIEARLLKRFGGTAKGRIGAAAGLRALKVLVRRHPDAALDMAGAAALEAGRSGLSELKRLLLRRARRAGLTPPGEGRARS